MYLQNAFQSLVILHYHKRGLRSYRHAHCNVGKLITVPFQSFASLWLHSTLNRVSTYPCLGGIVPEKIAFTLNHFS